MIDWNKVAIGALLVGAAAYGLHRVRRHRPPAPPPPPPPPPAPPSEDPPPVTVPSAPAPTLTQPQPIAEQPIARTATTFLRGANLAGGDTLWSTWPTDGSGPVSGTHYQFVGSRDVDYLVDRGFDVFRVLFAWEALQPAPYARIPSGPPAHTTYAERLFALVDYITRVKDKTVLLDVHGGDDSTFAAYRGVRVGKNYQGYAIDDMLCDLWWQLAQRYKGDERVMFGITNEPAWIPTVTWFACAQRIVDAIRSTGAKNVIVMPGDHFTGAGSWTDNSMDVGVPKRSNAWGWENARGPGQALEDPLGRTWVQVHLYLDQDAGGGTEQVLSPTIGVERLSRVVDWARGRGLQVFVGEVGLSAKSPIAAEAWRRLAEYMDQSRNVVRGFAWWAYGVPSWWGGYRFALAPPDEGYAEDSAQMRLITGLA